MVIVEQGRYRAKRLLERTGRVSLYLAEDDGQEVLLYLVEDASLDRASFLRGVDALRQLPPELPIARLLDAGEHATGAWVVTEHHPGRTWADVVEKRCPGAPHETASPEEERQSGAHDHALAPPPAKSRPALARPRGRLGGLALVSLLGAAVVGALGAGVLLHHAWRSPVIIVQAPSPAPVLPPPTASIAPHVEPPPVRPRMFRR